MKRNSNFRHIYTDFVDAYDIGYVQVVKDTDLNSNHFYYLPHHVVAKQSKSK